MSWECETCGDSHPGRFTFCPVSGKHRNEPRLGSAYEILIRKERREVIAEAERLIRKGYDPETHAPLDPRKLAEYVGRSLRITFGLENSL